MENNFSIGIWRNEKDGKVWYSAKDSNGVKYTVFDNRNNKKTTKSPDLNLVVARNQEPYKAKETPAVVGSNIEELNGFDLF